MRSCGEPFVCLELRVHRTSSDAQPHWLLSFLLQLFRSSRSGESEVNALLRDLARSACLAKV
jgi:hypothetical protein